MSAPFFLIRIIQKKFFLILIFFFFSSSYQNVGVPKPPDLWIHHDQMELKNIDKNIHSTTPGKRGGLYSYQQLLIEKLYNKSFQFVATVLRVAVL